MKEQLWTQAVHELYAISSLLVKRPDRMEVGKNLGVGRGLEGSYIMN
jgi:hypothetical protein